MSVAKGLNERGFSLISVLLGCTLSVILAFTVASIADGMQKVEKRANIIAMLHAKRSQFIETIRKPEAWNFTVARQENGLSCLQGAGSDCRNISNTPLPLNSLMDANGSTLWARGSINGNVSSSSGAPGFNTFGTSCGTYGLSPSRAGGCSFQYSLTVTLHCPSGASVACIRPDVTVNGVLSISEIQNIIGPINPASFNFSVLREDTLAFRGTHCPPGSVQTGVKPDGELECRSMVCQLRQSDFETGSAQVQCGADEYVMSGGGECKTKGYITESRPLGPTSWRVICKEPRSDLPIPLTGPTVHVHDNVVNGVVDVNAPLRGTVYADANVWGMTSSANVRAWALCCNYNSVVNQVPIP